MSIKRRIQYNINSIANYLKGLKLPGWFTSIAFRLTCLALILFFSFAYILKTASTSANGYKIKNLEQEAYLLEKDVNDLQVQLAQNSSINNIKSRLADVDMIRIPELKFYSYTGNEMALK